MKTPYSVASLKPRRCSLLKCQNILQPAFNASRSSSFHEKRFAVNAGKNAQMEFISF